MAGEQNRWKYLPALLIFAVSFSGVMIEMLSIRGARVAFEGDFLFFIVPLTFLGLCAGSIGMFLMRMRGRLFPRLYLAILFLCFSVLHFFSATYAHIFSEQLPVMVAFFLSSFLAYTCAGWMIVEIINERKESFVQTYMLDLSGASLGTIAAVFLLNLFGYESAVTLACCVAALPTFVLLSNRTHARIFGVVVLLATTIFFIQEPRNIFFIPCAPQEDPVLITSNAYSVLHSVIHSTDTNETGEPENSEFHVMIDCGGGSLVMRAAAPGEHEKLTSDINSVSFAFVQGIDPNAEVLIPDAGGGSDVLRAYLLHVEHIDAIELNPDMVSATKILTGTSPYPYSLEGVHLFLGDTRRFIETTSKHFDLIEVANSTHYGEAPADVGTISYAQSVEAFGSFLAHLSPDGVLAVIKHPEPLRNTPILAALEKEGVSPAGRAAYINGGDAGLDMVLIKPSGFSQEDRAALKTIARARGFDAPMFATSSPEWLSSGADYTDDRPYPQVRETKYYTTQDLQKAVYIIVGCAAAFILLALLFLRNLLRIRGREKILTIVLITIGAAALGFGFVFLELGLMQKVLFFMSDSSYTTAIALSAFLLAGAAGVFLTKQFRLDRTIHAAVGAFCCFALYVVFMSQNDTHLFYALLPKIFAFRAFAAVIIMVLPTIFVGVYLPLLMRISISFDERLVPWVWFIDGLFGVLGGFCAKAAFHGWGLHTVYPVTLISYALITVAIIGLSRLASD